MSCLLKLSLQFFPHALTASSLSISPKHLREISDPILVLLAQLHKLVFLTQLPPKTSPSVSWTLLHLYKRTLFKQGSSALQLKTELHKLVHGGAERVAGLEEEEEGEGLRAGKSKLVHTALQEMASKGLDFCTCAADQEEHSALTYEVLQKMIEELALEHGYHQSTHARSTSS